MKRAISIIISVIIVLLVFSGCSGQKSGGEEYRREFYSMDTVVVIRIPSGAGISSEQAEAAFDAAETAFEDIAARVTRFPNTDSEKAASEVWAVNENAGVAPVHVSDDVWNLIATSLHYGEITGGKFNIVMGAMSDLWGFSTQEYRVPSDEEIKETLALCSLSDVVLNEDEHTVYLKKPGMKMDLGAAAKGYATDVMAQALKSAGIKSAIIDAGGNICAIGTKPDGSDWSVGIQHPRDASDIAGRVDVCDEFVVSSGDYQRYFEVDGVRYCHIFDPDTGYPVRGASASAVIWKDGMTADILSTSIMLLGEDDAAMFALYNPEFSDLSWVLIYVDTDGEIYFYGSEAMEGRFIFEE
ncbi:MAG: FAD:protein FMN transferase [Clostridia bacterium]|nr:FAD:protein FMN transferase [Clostridia bacterium]